MRLTILMDLLFLNNNNSYKKKKRAVSQSRLELNSMLDEQYSIGYQVKSNSKG